MSDGVVNLFSGQGGVLTPSRGKVQSGATAPLWRVYLDIGDEVDVAALQGLSIAVGDWVVVLFFSDEPEDGVIIGKL